MKLLPAGAMKPVMVTGSAVTDPVGSYRARCTKSFSVTAGSLPAGSGGKFMVRTCWPFTVVSEAAWPRPSLGL